MTDFTPTFLGQPVLGASPPLTASMFAGDAAQADDWLGNPPGTTAYNPGRSIAVAGQLVAPTADAAAEALQALQALAGAAGPLVVPSGLSDDGWDLWTSCRLDPSGLVAGAPQAIAGGYAIGYRALFRCAGTRADSITMVPPATAGEWGPQPGQVGPDFEPGSGRWIQPPNRPDW